MTLHLADIVTMNDGREVLVTLLGNDTFWGVAYPFDDMTDERPYFKADVKRNSYDAS